MTRPRGRGSGPGTIPESLDPREPVPHQAPRRDHVHNVHNVHNLHRFIYTTKGIPEVMRWGGGRSLPAGSCEAQGSATLARSHADDAYSIPL